VRFAADAPGGRAAWQLERRRHARLDLEQHLAAAARVVAAPHERGAHAQPHAREQPEQYLAEVVPGRRLPHVGAPAHHHSGGRARCEQQRQQRLQHERDAARGTHVGAQLAARGTRARLERKAAARSSGPRSAHARPPPRAPPPDAVQWLGRAQPARTLRGLRLAGERAARGAIAAAPAMAPSISTPTPTRLCARSRKGAAGA
jgi:hypothetical protein